MAAAKAAAQQIGNTFQSASDQIKRSFGAPINQTVNINVKSNTGQAQSQLAKFKRDLEQTEATAKRLDQTLARRNRGGLFSTLTRNITTANVAAGLLLRGIDSVTNSIASAIKAGAGFEQLTLGLEAFTGSVADATALYEEFTQTALKTPFNIQQVANAGRVLLAFGLNIEQATEGTRQLSLVAGATGGDLTNLARNLGQIQAQGKAFTRDLNQFAIAGIPVFAELSKVIGASELEIRKLTTEGKVGFDSVSQALSNLTAEGGAFAVLAERQLSTVVGAFANLQTEAFNLAGALNKVSSPVIVSFFNTLSSLLTVASDNLLGVAGAAGAAGVAFAKSAFDSSDYNKNLQKQKDIQEELQKANEQVAKTEQRLTQTKAANQKIQNRLIQTSRTATILEQERTKIQRDLSRGLITADGAAKRLARTNAALNTVNREKADLLRGNTQVIAQQTRLTDSLGVAQKRQAVATSNLAKANSALAASVKSVVASSAAFIKFAAFVATVGAAVEIGTELFTEFGKSADLSEDLANTQAKVNAVAASFGKLPSSLNDSTLALRAFKDLTGDTTTGLVQFGDRITEFVEDTRLTTLFGTGVGGAKLLGAAITRLGRIFQTNNIGNAVKAIEKETKLVEATTQEYIEILDKQDAQARATAESLDGLVRSYLATEEASKARVVALQAALRLEEQAGRSNSGLARGIREAISAEQVRATGLRASANALIERIRLNGVLIDSEGNVKDANIASAESEEQLKEARDSAKESNARFVAVIDAFIAKRKEEVATAKDASSDIIEAEERRVEKSKKASEDIISSLEKEKKALQDRSSAAREAAEEEIANLPANKELLVINEKLSQITQQEIQDKLRSGDLTRKERLELQKQLLEIQAAKQEQIIRNRLKEEERKTKEREREIDREILRQREDIAKTERELVNFKEKEETRLNAIVDLEEKRIAQLEDIKKGIADTEKGFGDVEAEVKNIITATGGVDAAVSSLITQGNSLATAYNNAAKALERAADAARDAPNVAQRASFAGGYLGAGQASTINEFGKEAFLTNSGRLNWINKPAWSTWRPPESGTVIPAHIASSMNIPSSGLKINRNVGASNVGSSEVQIVRALRSLNTGNQTNNVTITTPNPGKAMSDTMVALARIKRRRGR